MPRPRRFAIIFAPETMAHLDVIERKDHRLIRETVDKQLSFLPEQVTRNQQAVRTTRSFRRHVGTSIWPCQSLPGLLEVESDARVVQLLAIGIKERNKLFIGGEEFEP